MKERLVLSCFAEVLPEICVGLLGFSSAYLLGGLLIIGAAAISDH